MEEVVLATGYRRARFTAVLKLRRPTCPACRSNSSSQAVLDLGNAGRAVAAAAVAIVALPLAVIGLGGLFEAKQFPLKRQCQVCGLMFAGRRQYGCRMDTCPRCWYCLVGNLSGVCPECGWRLTRRFKKHLRKHVPQRPSGL